MRRFRGRVEPISDGIAAVLRDAGHTGSLGQVLADEAVGVLRRTAFPRMVRAGEDEAGVYELDSAGRVSIENPPPTWMNVGWVLEGGWFAPLARVNEGLRYNMFPVDNGILYVPGLDAWIGFKEGEDGPTIHWTRVFEGTSTGTRTGG